MRVLAGDVGGTKTAIAIAEVSAGGCRLLRTERYPSAGFSSLEEIVSAFLSRETARPAAAGFGVAGPVRENIARATKLPWRIDARLLSRRLGIRRIALLNDFAANGLGLRLLSPRRLATLSRGRLEEGGPVALLGAGTGLGEAAVLRAGGRDEIVASEGGHADFGPRTPLEDRLVAFLRRRFGRVSRDRILSGGGLVLLYEFLRADGFARPGRAAAEEFARGSDPAAVVSRFGLSGRDRLCRKALSLFVSIYGSEAGNLALQYRATGGVYVAGGIAPKILPALRGPAFLRAFREKPPMEPLLAKIPVKVVLDPALGLYGAAAGAYWMAIEETRPS